MITIEMLQDALYSSTGLTALIVLITQIFKNLFKTENCRWANHLLALISSFLCSGAVLGCGLIWNIGMYAGFDINSISQWIIWTGGALGMSGAAMGLYSFDFTKKFLEWLRLMPELESEIINE